MIAVTFACLENGNSSLGKVVGKKKKIAVLDSETETSTEHKVEGDSKSELNFYS